jgi:hypothetical protein
MCRTKGLTKPFQALSARSAQVDIGGTALEQPQPFAVVSCACRVGHRRSS